MVKYKVGDLIEDKYKVFRILGGPGKSGQGIVYVCTDEANKIIALKTLQNKYINSKEMKHSFKREALAWVQLEQHPYIVRAHFVKKIDDRPFIAIDYIGPDKKGRNTLKHHMENPLNLKDVLKWSIQFCYAMEYAESKGISPHRDIKPDNIMITANGDVKITDFGLVKFLDEKESIGDWRKLAEMGEIGLSFLRFSEGIVVGGTVPWMSPEQFDANTDVRSDIYSYGIVLYQMVNNGELPFHYNTVEAYFKAHKEELPQEIDSKLFPIIKKCLEKDPDYRYLNFKELRIDLEKIYHSEVGKKIPKPPKEEILKAEEHNNKGVSFATLDFKDEAIKEFRKALQLKPEFSNARINLGLLLTTKGSYDEAISEFRDALKLKPSSLKIRRNLAKALEAKGDINDAIEEYRIIVREAPYYINAHYHLARLCEKIGRIDDAITYFENFLNFTPKHTERAKFAKKKLKKLKKQKKQPSN